MQLVFKTHDILKHLLLMGFFLSQAYAGDSEDKPDLSRIHGRIQYVTSFPDYKVQVVKSFEDLRIQVVKSFPDSIGKWQIVDSSPDFKIQLVDSFPDFKIRYVDSFPGTK